MYALNISSFLHRNIAKKLKQVWGKHRAWLLSLLAPSVDMLQEFNDFRSEILAEISYNASKIVHEAGLNRYMPEAHGGIYIEPIRKQFNNFTVYDSQSSSAVFSEGFHQHSVFDVLPVSYGEIGFIVHYPAGINTDRLRALVDRYAYGGASYLLQAY